MALQTPDTHSERIEAAQEQASAQPPVATTAQAERMFRYSEFVDVGEGAIECEHARDGKCIDFEHFHAWCRLPNPYQHEDIRKKALAAKARKLRELRDPDSDSSVVLDQSLADLGDSAFVETLIDELLAREWAEDYIAAQREVEERDIYEHLQQDREEYTRLTAIEGKLPEEEQSEEYKALVGFMLGYVEDLRKCMAAIQEPKREELRSRDASDLVGLLRARRAEEEGDRAFRELYDAWMWFVGTLKVELHPVLGRPHLPMWEEIGRRDRPSAGTMFGEAPEVIEELHRVYNDLQIALQRGSSGN